MDITLTADQRAIEEAVGRICARFDDDYWSACDREARFPEEFHRAMAEGGWLGITMPTELGGAGLGVTEAALMMHTVTQHGGGFSAASTIHINLFGPHPIVVHGTDEQKARWLAPLIKGEEKACFGVTEPDAGLDTTSICDLRDQGEGRLSRQGPQDVDHHGAGSRQDPAAHAHHTQGRVQEADRRHDAVLHARSTATKIEVRRIEKMGRNAVDSNAVFIDDLFVPEEDRIGEEGKGFRYLLDGLNPERILIACRGHRHRPRRAEARERLRARARTSSAGPSARTRASSIRSPKAGPISKAPSGWRCARPRSTIRRNLAAPKPMPPSSSAPAPPSMR